MKGERRKEVRKTERASVCWRERVREEGVREEGVREEEVREEEVRGK